MSQKKPKKDEVKENAEALLGEGRLDEAMLEYKALIALDPSDPCSHFGLCDTYHQKGMLKEALEKIDDSIGLRPGWPFYNNKKAKILEDLGETSLAVIELEEAIRIKPDFEDAKKNLKRLQKKSKRKGSQ